MSFDSLWEACRRAYIEHKSEDLYATCKNNYTASLRLCVYISVCVCVSLKIHYIIYWHGIEVLPQHLLLSAHAAHAVCQMCWVRPSVRPPPVGIFCNICDCLAATAGSLPQPMPLPPSSNVLSKQMPVAYVACLTAFSWLQAARTFRCIRKAVYSNEFWNDAATDGMAYCKDTTQPASSTRPAQPSPVLAWSARRLQHWLPWAH